MSARIMVVDDTEHVRSMLVQILRLHGFDVVAEAESGPEGLEQAMEHQPDVVVIDYRMPGQNGVEAARSIRSALPEQRIILYSAYLNRELEESARQAGVAACVSKGSGVEALATEISALVMDLGR